MGIRELLNLDEIFQKVEGELAAAGIAVDICGDMDACSEDAEGKPRVKVVCVSSGLKDALNQMGESARDQVAMVRVDGETSEALDAWVETGAVKSRSEAAALFIREGLKLRADELDRLRDALNDVNEARERLRQKAQEVFGQGEESPA